MKREDLLARAYTGNPMTIKGVEIVYCPMANEVLREMKTAYFSSGMGDQTDQAGMCEAILVMYLIAKKERQEITRLRRLPRAERHAEVLDFYLENEDEINAIKPELIARVEAVAASIVESEASGKSRQPHPDSSQP